MRGKKYYDKHFYFVKMRNNWFIIPTVVFFYNKETFLETGVYTPAWGLNFKWLIFTGGFQIQESYKI